MTYTPSMSAIQGWRGVAFNQATESENRIHADDVARKYGFRGGLVPGVTVYAYLVQPAVAAWGMEWLEGGHARAVFRTPLYDGSEFSVEVKETSAKEELAKEASADGAVRFDAQLLDPEGVCCSEGDAGLGTPAAEARRTLGSPVLRGDPRCPERDARPDATRRELERLRESGLGALHAEWQPDGHYGRYLRELDAVPMAIRPDGGGYANPAFSLGLANSVLAANVSLGPWIHVQSDVQHFAAIPAESALTVEASIEDLFERSGHEFVDLDVSVFLATERPALRVQHRAIYVLREPSS